MTRRTHMFDNPEAGRAMRIPVKKGLELAVNQRANMDQSTLLSVLEDRSRRFYRAKLIYKCGAFGYHILGDWMFTMFREQLAGMMNVQDLWDAYVDGVKKGVTRSQAIQKAPLLPRMEMHVEDWIWWAEYIIGVCKKGDEQRWTMDALELGSAIIDGGCVKVVGHNPKLVKTPANPGWQAVAWWP
ncbi:hypothetical protein [Marinobacter sp. ELB17]|uniref:hypothetical protein n=1 Tax=Marinobacter sp. ELB17 TaxID=270374 RepID=UPI0000F38206|nr:hypothetical protein [Marinobacter sp. ELB17]EAZ98171.1 hypothetical protein MELB17_09813 [Marinobacter sp. ELB17]